MAPFIHIKGLISAVSTIFIKQLVGSAWSEKPIAVEASIEIHYFPLPEGHLGKYLVLVLGVDGQQLFFAGRLEVMFKDDYVRGRGCFFH